MFAVFADQACTANIYTYEFNIACMHAAERLLFSESLYPQNIPAIRYSNTQCIIEVCTSPSKLYVL